MHKTPLAHMYMHIFPLIKTLFDVVIYHFDYVLSSHLEAVKLAAPRFK